MRFNNWQLNLLKKIDTTNVRSDFLKRKRCEKMVNKWYRHNRLRECEGEKGEERKQTLNYIRFLSILSSMGLLSNEMLSLRTAKDGWSLVKTNNRKNNLNQNQKWKQKQTNKNTKLANLKLKTLTNSQTWANYRWNNMHIQIHEKRK